MGFAKYQEDIVSRYVSDNRDVHNTLTEPSETKIKKKNSIEKKVKPMTLKKFAIQKARPLPVIILADTSGSMSDEGKIEALNTSIKDMISTFSKEGRRQAEIQLVLITFGGDRAEIHLPLIPAHEVSDFQSMGATGRTPMGGAFELATKLLEDKERIPSRAYRPALILLSDGHPTDDWQKGFDKLRNSERAKKAMRFAMAIGNDADEIMLSEFVNDNEAPVFKAHEARDIHHFFRVVTMSVTTRTRSQTPNDFAAIDFDEIENADDDLGLDLEGQW